MSEASERLRLLTQATRDAVYEYDLRSNTIVWSDNLQLWGYKPDDVDPGLDWWANRIHPDDRDATFTSLENSIQSQLGTFEATYRFRCGDGQYRYTLDRGVLQRDADGVPIRLIGAMQDVQLYRMMFERNPQAMWAFDIETLRFLDVNEMALRLYGYSREEFLSMRLTDIRPPEDVPLLQSVVQSSDREHEGRSIWRHFTKSGDLLHVEVRTQELEINGSPARIAIITDVSRRIVVEQQIREAQKLEAIGQLAGGIAHDFNNILTVIQGLSRATLTSLTPDHPLYANLKAIDQAASSAVGLTQHLLTFAHQREVQSQSLLWASVISNSEFLLRKLLPEQVQLEFVTLTGPATIELDVTQAEQILFNLISNARDAITGPGHIRVTSAVVAMYPGHPDNNANLLSAPYLQLTIADTGVGMSEATQSHLFEPFFTTKSGGTGLGLSTVYGIVRQASGLIRVESEPGQGTEFRIYLPLSPQPPLSDKIHKVLLVEDDPDLRTLISNSLTSEGFQVLEATNGLDALAALASNKVDIVLTDIVMPEREGLELIQTIRKSSPTLPILAISGAFEGRFLALAKTFGANHILRKPIDIPALASQLRSLLH